jgi:hypothetical protein
MDPDPGGPKKSRSGSPALTIIYFRFKQREDRRQRYIAEAGGGKGREDFGLPGGDQLKNFKKGFSS